MPLIRAQKEKLVTEILSELKESRISLVLAYQNLNAVGNLSLRDKAFDQGGKIKMISNKLLALVLKTLGQDSQLDIPQRQLALAYGFEDEVTAAKLLADFAKETGSLEVIGGWIDGKFFSASDVTTLASLPSKETLQAQVVGRLNGLIQSLAYNLNFPLQQFAYVVRAVEESKK